MVKPLTFKGDKKPKKRKRDRQPPDGDDDDQERARPVQRVDDDAAASDDSWVSAEAVGDVGGPVVVVLPTDVPSALACDAAGTVFAMTLENVVDANPASAEPHDVRQVWVASRVAGTESFRFKAHHERYDEQPYEGGSLREASRFSCTCAR